MAKEINFSITPQGGEIDKYEVRLFDNSGENVLQTKTYTPPFADPITGTFTGVSDDTNYNIGIRSYIGAKYKDCPLKPVSTTAPIVYITGSIQGVGGAVTITGLSQSISCDRMFEVYGMSNSGSGDSEFSAVITLLAGQTSVTLPNADGNGGVVISITPNTSGGTTFVATTSCGGTTYVYTLAIDGASSPFLFKYGVTEADTTGAALTEAEYLASVDATFTAGTELSGIADDSGADVVVDAFGNGTVDKVCFVQVAASEAAFTKWSEVGNPFQQNQPIDQSFYKKDSNGDNIIPLEQLSNVWFKSTRAGQTIYITRSQTSFVGSVIFSR